MAANLRIDVGVYRDMATQCQNQAKMLNAIVSSYISTMQYASEHGLMSGAAGTQMRNFVSMAKELDGKLEVIGEQTQATVSRFLDTVEATDHLAL